MNSGIHRPCVDPRRLPDISTPMLIFAGLLGALITVHSIGAPSATSIISGDEAQVISGNLFLSPEIEEPLALDCKRNNSSSTNKIHQATCIGRQQKNH